MYIDGVRLALPLMALKRIYLKPGEHVASFQEQGISDWGKTYMASLVSEGFTVTEDEELTFRKIDEDGATETIVLGDSIYGWSTVTEPIYGEAGQSYSMKQLLPGN
jgi:hypothetical protein